MTNSNNNKITNATIDIVKFIMAILVIGIHTEPFSFNIWLDRAYGIVTRICVPFFFVTSSYFFYSKEKNAFSYIKRLLIIYVIWSLIYLPFDIKDLTQMSFSNILARYLWFGNEHALWYLCGSIIGFIIINLLLKLFKSKTVFFISIIFLIIGCIISTWSPMFNISLKNASYLSRNGLFYAFPYMSLGMIIAKSKEKYENKNIKKLLLCFIISFVLLAIECYLFVVKYNTQSTILWLSVLPCAYTFFLLCNNININLNKNISIILRRLSTLMYVSHYIFIILLKKYLSCLSLFISTVLLSILLGFIIIKLSKKFKLLNYLY